MKYASSALGASDDALKDTVESGHLAASITADDLALFAEAFPYLATGPPLLERVIHQEGLLGIALVSLAVKNIDECQQRIWEMQKRSDCSNLNPEMIFGEAIGIMPLVLSKIMTSRTVPRELKFTSAIVGLPIVGTEMPNLLVSIWMDITKHLTLEENITILEKSHELISVRPEYRTIAIWVMSVEGIQVSKSLSRWAISILASDDFPPITSSDKIPDEIARLRLSRTALENVDDFVDRLQPGALSDWEVSVISEELLPFVAGKSLSKAMEIALRLDGTKREAAIRGIVDVLGNSDLVSLADALAANSKIEKGGQALEIVFGQLGERAPLDGLALSEHVDPSLRENVYGAVASAWARSDPGAYSNWLASRGDVKDEEIGFLVKAIPDDLEAAFTWLSRIQNPEAKLELRNWLASQWKEDSSLFNSLENKLGSNIDSTKH